MVDRPAVGGAAGSCQGGDLGIEVIAIRHDTHVKHGHGITIVNPERADAHEIDVDESVGQRRHRGQIAVTIIGEPVGEVLDGGGIGRRRHIARANLELIQRSPRRAAGWIHMHNRRGGVTGEGR